jgi:putative hydrolase
MKDLQSTLKDLESFDQSNVPAIDFHMHTNWTDGAAPVVEVYNKAVEENLEHILYSEHARAASGDWFLEYASEVKALPDVKCQAYVGCEVKILDEDGSLDINAQIYDACDFVMASVHRFPGEKGIVKGLGSYQEREVIEIEKKLSLGALKNDQVSILGHPFGMSLRRFSVMPTDDDFLEVIKLAAKTGVRFEINSHYHPELWKLIDMCRAEGCLISLGSNAHKLSEIGNINQALKGPQNG